MRSRVLPRIFKSGAAYLLSLVWIIPVWPLINTALKDTEAFRSSGYTGLSSSFELFSNFIFAWNEAGLAGYVVNSFLYAGIGVFLCIAFSSLAMYSIAVLKPRFGNIVFIVIFLGTVFPFQMYLIPLFKMYQNIGLHDTRTGMILVYSALTIPYASLIFRSYFAMIPNEIHEAAEIDGLTPWKRYLYMVIPISRSAVVVVFLYQFTWIWNELIFGLILTSSDKTRTVMAGIAAIMDFISGSVYIPGVMAGVILVSIPTIIIFFGLRKYFISGLKVSAAGGK